jgi:hypothetical protein
MMIVTLTRRDLRDRFTMVDEAFALSPINARAALPSEADYEAIREAFMETARGRWFLGEYGKRNRNADTRMVLDAVARIETTIAAAQKPAPSNELPDALVLIRGLLSDARASAARTMSGPDAELALAAVNKATRIIREIAWTLREYGTDTRICDMLDAQVNAVETSHQHTMATEKRDAVLATYDLLIRRIGELGGSADAAAEPLSESASSPTSGADNEANAVAAAQADAAFSHDAETTAQAAVEVAATSNEIAARDITVQASTAAEMVAEDTAAQDTTRGAIAQDNSADYFSAQDPTPHPIEDVVGQDLSVQDLSVQDLSVQDLSVQDLAAPDLAAPEIAAAGATAHQSPLAPALSSENSNAAASAEAIAPASPEPEVAGTASADAAALDLEIAQDMAILDAVAVEMADPGFAQELARQELAQQDLAGQNLAGQNLIQQDPPGQTLAGAPQATAPDRGERGPIEPAISQSITLESITAEAAAAEPVSLALVSKIAVMPRPESDPPSLGATLIAAGILSQRNAAKDALAPFRRMSQAERIAFFS